MLFSLSFLASITYNKLLQMNQQLTILSAWTLSGNQVTLYASVPKMRKLYKFLNDNFTAIKEMDGGEKKLAYYFKLSQENFIDELNYLINFIATIRILYKGKEKNVYTRRQINAWNKTRKQLMDFEEKYKKHVIGLIRKIPYDLTENIASYL